MNIQPNSINRKAQFWGGVFVFLVSMLTYLRTMASTTSFWDCGEFIACSKILGVMHPPGAPLYLLINRIMTMLPLFKDIGMRVNFFSVLVSAATVLLTYLIIVQLIQRWRGEPVKWEDRLIVYGSGILGALAFAFTDSFWFNAVEAEVYAFSMFFTALVVWLALYWEERSQNSNSIVYIFLIFYLFAMAFGVHLLNFLVFPFVVCLAFFHHEETVRRFLLLVTVQIVVPMALYILLFQFNPDTMGYTELIEHQDKAGRFLLIFGALWVFATLVYMYSKDRKVFKLWWILPASIALAYSLYLVIYIRAGLHPPINENDPSTFSAMKDYLARKQYGNESLLLTVFYRKAAFWSYQIQLMYTRYFGWQFIGKGTTLDAHDRIVEIISLKGLYGLPFLVGIWGMMHHFTKDWKRALAVLILFLMTGYAIIIYLNQPDPQPRERDYSYVGSFFAFALWIGIGMAGIWESISKALQNRPLLKKLALGLSVLLLCIAVPVNLFAFNFHSHDRQGNYVAYDYSKNILETCEPDGIIFTNGDNDTFPLWFLQEVEGIRKDVRIVNLSLLNTPWYIKQLRDQEPRVPITLSDRAIETLAPMEWEEKKIAIPIPKHVQEAMRVRYGNAISMSDTFVFNVKPTFRSGGAQGIRVQDLMVIHILYANQWRKPIYYAVTVSSDNTIGLQKYFRMDGLAFRILPFEVKDIDPQVLEENLLKKYQYRNLNNAKVYNDINIIKLLQNYRSAFLQLAQYYQDQNQNSEVIRILDKMNEIMPLEVILYSDERAAVYVYEMYRRAGRPGDLDFHLGHVLPGQPVNRQDKLLLASYLMFNLQKWDRAEQILQELRQYNPEDVEVYYELLRLYALSRQHKKAVALLETWVLRHPEDTSAREELERLRQLQFSDTIETLRNR